MVNGEYKTSLGKYFFGRCLGVNFIGSDLSFIKSSIVQVLRGF